MLSIENKIAFLKEYLLIKNDNYGDEMKEELHLNYFELGNEIDFMFLDKLNSKKEIENKIELLVSKMILHEHEDALTNIVANYI